MSPNPHLLLEANHRLLTAKPPNVAILPWGATEAHNWHLPYGTDVIEVTRLADRSAELAFNRGANVVVLPTIPFGNDEQQLDQVCTISFTTATAFAVLRDVVRSLVRQGIDRLVVLNGHGGNQFQPLVRDLQGEFEILIVVVNFYELCPELVAEVFDDPGDHAGELETSLLLYLCPELVELAHAGPGERNPFSIESLAQPGVWTPRPWSHTHPDTGSGNPQKATAEKGERYFTGITAAISQLLVELSQAEKGQLPYV